VEHGCAGIAALVAPHVFVDVALQPLLRDGVVDAPDAVLEQTKEPLDGLRVNFALDVDPGRVVDPSMPLTGVGTTKPLGNCAVDGWVKG
jgi:hypothetical protein